jgi:AcrR family transcriptional regulator
MPRVKTATKENAILDAASRVFSQRPYHEVLIDHIAGDASIGKGTIYRYFPTKEDLYYATILHGLDTLTEIAGRAIEPEEDPARRLESIAKEILEFFWDRVHLFPLLPPQNLRNFERHAEMIRRRGKLLRLVQETILAGIERREFRGVDARIAAEMFLGMVRSMVLFRGAEDSRADLVENVMGVFIRGLQRGGE